MPCFPDFVNTDCVKAKDQSVCFRKITHANSFLVLSTLCFQPLILRDAAASARRSNGGAYKYKGLQRRVVQILDLTVCGWPSADFGIRLGSEPCRHSGKDTEELPVFGLKTVLNRGTTATTRQACGFSLRFEKLLDPHIPDDAMNRSSVLGYGFTTENTLLHGVA